MALAMTICGTMRTPARRRTMLGFAFCIAAFSIAAAQNDATALQRRAIERIDSYRQNFLKTGDSTSLAPELERVGQGRSEMEGRKDFAAAADHFQEAVTISSALTDRTQLFNALSYVAQVQLATGDMVGAADILNRALALAPEVKDQSLPLFVYIDRADIYWKLADKCDRTKAFAAGLENLKLARVDYETAIALARKFNYAGLVPMIQQLVGNTVTKGQMI